MPIGKISKSGNNFSSAAEYDLAQGRYAEQEADKKPEILEQNFLSATSYKELGKEYNEVADFNKKCKNPVIKFSVSFDPKEKLADTQKLEFTKKVMKEMGIREDNNQYMISRHSDKGHDHHHILANRVGMDGKVLSDSYSKYRLETAIDKVEKQMGFNNDLAKTRRFVFDETQEKGYKVQKENFRNNREKVSTKDTKKGIAEKKEYIKNNVEKSLQESKSVAELQTKLQEKNISVDARIDKSNKLTGISFNYDNFSVKGSALGKEFKSAGISKTLQSNLEKDQEKKKFQELNLYQKANAKTQEVLAKFEKKPFISPAVFKEIEKYEKLNKDLKNNPNSFSDERLKEIIEKSERIISINQGNKYSRFDQITEQKEVKPVQNQEKPKTEEKKVEIQQEKPKETNPFDQVREQREAKKEQEQEQDRPRGRGR